MAVKVYHDSDADLSIIQNKRVTFVGFGNQGKITIPDYILYAALHIDIIPSRFCTSTKLA